MLSRPCCLGNTVLKETLKARVSSASAPQGYSRQGLSGIESAELNYFQFCAAYKLAWDCFRSVLHCP